MCVCALNGAFQWLYLNIGGVNVLILIKIIILLVTLIWHNETWSVTVQNVFEERISSNSKRQSN